MTSDERRRPGQRTATEQLIRREGSVTPEAVLAFRARAHGTARRAHVAENSARLVAQSSEFATRTLKALHSPDAEATAGVLAPAPPAESLLFELADMPSYRAARPPDTGVEMGVDGSVLR
jgi:hypothetical protein